MSQGKIEPLIAAAAKRAEEYTDAELRALIAAVDEEIAEHERQLDQKLAEITARVTKLEAGVVAPSSD